MGLYMQPFGIMSDGTKVLQYELDNEINLRVNVIPYGARVTGIFTPDRNGVFDDIVWGYDSLEEYLAPRDSQGAIIGRYAGRITNAHMTVAGREYSLVKNAGEHTLHGGTGTGACFSEKIWTVEDCGDSGEPYLTLSLLSEDGEGGFPGNLTVFVTYRLMQDGTLCIQYRADADQTTAINLTSHCFFNLQGFRSPSVRDQLLYCPAERTTETCQEDVVTGRIIPTAGTPLDFTMEKPLGMHMDAYDYGYNHCLVLPDGHGACALASTLFDPKTGRQMQVFTDQPGLQLYTAGHIKPDKKGKNGSAMEPLGAVCLETQHFPDSVHHPEFPSTILEKGYPFFSMTKYTFSVRGHV